MVLGEPMDYHLETRFLGRYSIGFQRFRLHQAAH